MNDEINYKSNPLHGVSLKTMLTELVDHYGFEILHAYLYINCFKTNPSIASSIKFLSKTDWARENVEGFYLYQFKRLPRASDEQFLLSPRDRLIPAGQVAGPPAELSLADAEQLRAKREKKADGFRSGPGRSTAAQRSHAKGRQGSRDASKPRHEAATAPGPSVWHDADPWGKAKK
ncbi:MAG TPA: VF530 family DNA-binding protein [Hyphomicrobiales bacterium]|nr:VF530 family DNA-binding protein [Hyphomicrobiales bacterium]